jgi:hypothetical protein
MTSVVIGQGNLPPGQAGNEAGPGSARNLTSAGVSDLNDVSRLSPITVNSSRGGGPGRSPAPSARGDQPEAAHAFRAVVTRGGGMGREELPVVR